MRRFQGYVLLSVWTALAAAIQLTLLTAAPGVGVEGAEAVRAAVPDLATLVLVAAIGRLTGHDLVALAAASAMGRVAFTAASPFAVLAGSLGVAFAAEGIRRVAELDRPSLRFGAAFVGAGLYSGWMLFVDLIRSSEARLTGAIGAGRIDLADGVQPLVSAGVSAVAALVLWPLIVRLPGLGRLERRGF